MKLEPIHYEVLEKIKNEKIEYAGNKQNLNYREKIALGELARNGLIEKDLLAKYWRIKE